MFCVYIYIIIMETQTNNKKVINLGVVDHESCVIRKNNYGFGIYSLKDFEPGEIVYRYKFTPIPEDVKSYTEITPEGLLIEDTGYHYYPIKDFFIRSDDQYINHSCGNDNIFESDTKLPTSINDEDGFGEIKAKKKINIGDELFYNYNLLVWDMWDHDFECFCGSENCYKVIKGFKYLPKEEQERLIPLASPEIKDFYYNQSN